MSILVMDAEDDVFCESVCRACLSVRRLATGHLLESFEEFTGVQVPEVLGVPTRLCLWCASQLQRCLSFQERCRATAEALTQIAEENGYITMKQLESISSPFYSLTTTLTQLIDLTPTKHDMKSEPEELEPEEKSEAEESDLEGKSELEESDLEGKSELEEKYDDIEYLEPEYKIDNEDEDKEDTLSLSYLEPLETEDDDATESKLITINIEPIDRKTSVNIENKTPRLGTPKKRKKNPCKSVTEDGKKRKKRTGETLLSDKLFEEEYNTKVERFPTVELQRQDMVEKRDTPAFRNMEYKCLQCYKGFHSLHTYKNHMVLHSEVSGQFSCPVCALRSATQRNLISHRLYHIQRFTCNQCGHATCFRQRAVQHHRLHQGLQYECGECKMQFRSRGTYEVHLTRHARVACGACGARVRTRRGLAYHMRKAHKSTRCECGVEFKDLHALCRHRRGGHCPGENANACVHCGGDFPSDELLQKHVADVHADEISLTCKQCKTTYETAAQFQRHKNWHQKMEQRAEGAARARAPPPGGSHVCEVCGYYTPYKQSFVEHQKRHSGERPHVCATCARGFATKYLLKFHSYTHSGERPHQCKHCPRAFAAWGNLRRHMQTVHGTARPFACEWCGKTFKRRELCRVHYNQVHLKQPTKRRIKKRTAPTAS